MAATECLQFFFEWPKFLVNYKHTRITDRRSLNCIYTDLILCRRRGQVLMARELRRQLRTSYSARCDAREWYSSGPAGAGLLAISTLLLSAPG